MTLAFPCVTNTLYTIRMSGYHYITEKGRLIMCPKMLSDIKDILSLEFLSTPYPIAVSPNGNQLAVVTKSHERQQAKGEKFDKFLPTGLPKGLEGSEIWIVNIKREESRNLTPNWGTSFRPAWSPDGKKLAFYSDRNEKAQLWIWDGRESEPRLASKVAIRTYYWDAPPLWTSDGMQIVVKTSNKIGMSKETGANENTVSAKVFTSHIANESIEDIDNSDVESELWWPQGVEKWLSADVGMITVATGEVQTLAQSFYPIGIRISPDVKNVAVMNFKGHTKLENTDSMYDVYLLPLDGTSPRLLAESLRFHGLLFSWSPDGRYIAYGTAGYPLAIQEAKNELFIVSTADGSQVCLTQDIDTDLVNGSHPPLWCSDSQHLFSIAQGHLWRINVTDRTVERLTDGFDRSVVQIVRRVEADTIWSPENTDSIYIQTLKGSEHGFHRVDLKTLEITQLAEEKRVYNPKGRNMDVASQTGEIYYSIEDVSHPTDVWVADADFLNRRQLTCLNPNVEKTSLGTSTIIKWQTPAGKQLRGALLLPADYTEGQSYPLITQVYGGSFLSRMGNDFGTDGIGHNFMLTNQNYVVFLPDMPMETNSPIQELTELVLSGIDKVIDMGIANANCLGLMGHSYGGYCVNALITQTSRFAAAVTSASICNLISFSGFLTEEGNSPWFTWTEKSQGKMGGSLWEFRDRYIENSPIFFLANVETPLLMIVGALDDSAVPQTGEMFSGLRRLGKKVVLVMYEDEGHVIQKGRYPNVVDYWQRVLTWFDEHFSNERFSK